MTRVASDLEAFTGETVVLLAGREFTFYNAEGVSRQLEQRRLRALAGLAGGNVPLAVATIDGLMLRAMPRDILAGSAVRLTLGGSYRIAEVVSALERCGYSRTEQVEGPGQYAQRGGILDFFSPESDEPARCEFFGR